MLKKAVQQGRRRVETGSVTSRVDGVTDFDEPRTTLGGLFQHSVRGGRAFGGSPYQ